MSNLFAFRHYLKFKFKNRQTIAQLRSGDLGSQIQAVTMLATTKSGHASRILTCTLKGYAEKQERLRNPHYERLREAIVDGLANIGGSSVTLLRAAYESRENDWKAHLASEVFERIFRKSVAGLRDPDHRVRVDASLSLDSLRDVRALGPLLAALRDSNANVRMNVAAALGRLHDPQAVPALMSLYEDADNMVRFFVISSLAEIGDKRAIPVVQSALNDQDMLVQVKAQEALGKIAAA